MYSIFPLIAAKRSDPWFPFLLSYAHMKAWPLHTEAAQCWFPFYHKVPPTLMRFLSYIQTPASQQETCIHLHCNSTLEGLEHYHIRPLQNHDLAFSGKIFRRCTVMQLQTGFHCTSTDHLDRKGEKQLISVFRELCLTCPIHGEGVAELPTSPSFYPQPSFVITASRRAQVF